MLLPRKPFGSNAAFGIGRLEFNSVKELLSYRRQHKLICIFAGSLYHKEQLPLNTQALLLPPKQLPTVGVQRPSLRKRVWGLKFLTQSNY